MVPTSPKPGNVSPTIEETAAAAETTVVIPTGIAKLVINRCLVLAMTMKTHLQREPVVEELAASARAAALAIAAVTQSTAAAVQRTPAQAANLALVPAQSPTSLRPSLQRLKGLQVRWQRLWELLQQLWLLRQLYRTL
ncbi:hypothetical protein J3E74DRAFT_289556 [Bipolaris maydis]|nr:hypothetical protein J3E74DRAFT_289556 [Bipolaris maydis]